MSVDSALRRPSGSVSGLTDITPRVAATNPAHRRALNAEPGGCGKCASDEQGNEEEGPETEEMNLEGDEELNDRERRIMCEHACVVAAFFNKMSPDITSDKYGCVTMDNYEIGRNVGRHFIKKGCYHTCA